MNISQAMEVHRSPAMDVASHGFIDRANVTGVLLANLIFVYALWWVVSIFARRKLPPGPIRLPVLGSLPFHGTTAPAYLKLKEQYGDIFTLFIGNVPLVVLGSNRIIKEAFDKKGNDFSGRGNGWLTMQFTGKKGGFAGSDYTPRFRETRSRALTILHSLGFGRAAMEPRIQKELDILIGSIADNNKNGFNAFKPVIISHFNILYKLLVGERIEYEKANEYTGKIENVYNDSTIGVLEIWAFMRFLPYFSSKAKCAVEQYNIMKKDIKDKITQKLESHKKGQTNDFLHAYIDKHIDMKSDSFGDDIDNLHQSTVDILINGVELSARSIQWMLILLANYPEIQEKAHAELNRVIGYNRAISLNDKDNLNYIQALIWEAQRFKPLFPQGLMHCAERESNLDGYTIPKGTQFIAVSPCIAWDSNIWDEPQVFKPERFLDSESGHFQMNPQFTPFLFGKRPCFGEGFARHILFLYTANILQNFEIRPPKGLNKVDEEGEFHFTFIPTSTELQFIKRWD